MNKNTARRSASNRTTTRLFFALTGLSFFLVPFAAYWHSQAAGAISGTVFRDYNGNGLKENSNPVEPGVGGITVNAYNAAGALVATAVSAANGTYTTPAVTGNVRLEFIIPTPAPAACSVDSNGTFSSGSGNVHGTSVRFVSEGATGVNFAVSSPGEFYTTDNPTVGVPLFNAGNPTGGGTAGTNSAFEVFDYTANSNTPIPASRATVSQIGTVWGSAYSPQAGRYFLSTVIKRHTGTGPLGASGIYTVNPNAAGSGSSFIDLSAVGAAASNTSGTYPYNDGRIGTGTNNQAIPFSDVVGANTGAAGARHRGLPKDVDAPLPVTSYSSYDAAAFEQAGKLAFGGLEISPDGRYLYAVNLYTKSLVRVDLQNPAAPVTPTAAQVASYTIPDPGCVGGNFRPWAAKYFRGKIYVGGVCDAQTTGAAANLKAYVYEFDIATNSFNTTPVINGYSLNYKKGAAIAADSSSTDPKVSAQWYPWTNNYSTLLQTFTTENTKYVRPQPIFADIEFDDADGSIIAAFMDRTGIQAGYRNWGPRDVQPDLQAGSTQTTNGAVEVSGGDVLRFYKNPAAGCAFVAESNGVSNGVSGSGAGNGQGPGGGEFFGAESFDSPKHSETITGALAVNYGSRAVMATNFDAFNPSPGVVGDVNSGGIRRFDMATGGLVAGTNGYNVYGPSNRGVTFAKGTGLGDIEMLRQSSPIELGNRVWRDTNGNGVQDPGENGISGVTARLFNSSNAAVATAVTNASGEYYFTSGTAADGNLTDHIGIVNGAIAPNTNYQIRLDAAADYTGAGALTGLVPTTRDQTAQAGFDDGSDSDALRVTNPPNSPIGTFPVIAVTTGTAGANDHTLDAGFVAAVSIGSTVYQDPNNNGLFDSGEAGICGASVELLYDADNSGAIAGTELTTAFSATTTSCAAGSIGNYFFSGLTPGNYQVRIPTAPATYTVSSSASVTDTADNQQDNDDNGTQTGGAGGSTISPLISLQPGAEPTNGSTATSETGQGSTLDDATTDANGDMTVDFGFFAPASLGNFVFIDTNRNGIQDAGETGLDGVTVTLYASNCTTVITTQMTATVSTVAGQYSFGGLAPGIYCVGFTRPNGYGFSPRDATGDAADSDADVLTGKTVAVTLVAGQNNPDIDAGVFESVSIGNRVWNDANNNGLIDTGEAAINGVTVNLYLDADGNGTPEGGIVRTTTTVGGLYLFDGLAPTTYIVAVVTPTNFTSSSVNAGDPNTDADDNDDNGVTTAGTETRSLPVTLTIGGEPIVENPNNDLNTINNRSDLTIDFGFRANPPTVVKLDKFDAFTDGGSVELRWSTGDEAGNLGFNVYREAGGKRHLLNRAPIAGNALRSGVQLEASGHDYTWTDNQAISNAVYYLEDIDVDGSVNLHGAVSPQFRQTLDNQPNARMFSDLANGESLAGVNEIVGGQKISIPNAKQLKSLIGRQQQIAAAGGAKITISRDGWYRISAQQLRTAGFDANPQLWQLYADGAEVPFKLNSDSIEFFGRATDTALTGSQTYYLVNAQTNGLRLHAVEGGNAGKTADASSFGVVVERRDRAVYVSSILNGDADNWFGAVVSRNSETVQNLNTFDVDERGPARLSVKLQGIVAGDHIVNVKFNDVSLGNVEFSGFENKQFEFDLPANAVREGANRVGLQSNGGSHDTSLVDAIRLSYRRGYTAKDNQLRFTVPANQTVRVNGFTDEKISVYEIGNGAARQQIVGAIENAAGDFGFSLSAANADRELIAVADSSVASALVTKNTPSTWTNPANQADFVIVTSDELRGSADKLAAMRQAQGLKTNVVAVEDLFDEFSFGKPDPSAVRQFLYAAATTWQLKPQYALLFGDSSYDSRNHLGLPVTRDVVPTKLVDTEYMETASDSWLADFDGDGAEDIALGRMPVGNRAEAAAAIEKLIRFDAQGARQEKTNLLIADNGFEDHSANLQKLLPRGINSFRVDRSQATDAETHRNIVGQLNRNPLLVTYTGHGSQNVWATSGIFNSSDAAALSNDQLSFYLLMNCLNGYTNQPTGESLAEALFKSTNGAIAVWTSSGITLPDNQAAISQAFTNFAFNHKLGKFRRIGDVVKAAKRASNDSDVRRTWQLVGDPTAIIK